MTKTSRSRVVHAVSASALSLGLVAACASPEPATAAPKHYVVDVGDAPTKGPATAKVTVVEFGDFQCEFCGQEEPIVQQILANYGTKILFAFKEFPLGIHPLAEGAAQAALAANAQGQFWPYHDTLYANQSNLSTSALEAYASQLGLDTTTFDAAITNYSYAGAVAVDVDQAISLGLDATPTFFVNGEMFVGTMNYATFAGIIDQALAAAQ